MYDYNMMDGYGWGGGMAMMLFWFLLLVLGAVFVIRLTKSHGSTNTHKSSAHDIAKERYAKGEIKKEEYVQITKDIR